jgi:hypothetical protein
MQNLLTVLALAMVAANPQIKPAAKVSPSPSTSPYTTETIDPSVTSLPPGYVGYSIERFYKEHIQPAKSEFETEAQYKARTAISEPMGFYAFRMGSLVGNAVDTGKPYVKYNAENPRFEITIRPKYDLHLGTPPRRTPTIVVNTTRSEFTKSEGGNALGAKVEVTSWTAETYGLRADGLPGTSGLLISIPCDAPKAQAVKDNLGFLAVASPANGKEGGPLTSSTKDFKEATIQYPQQVITNNHYVSVDTLSIWVYDTVTGEIYQKAEIVKR